MDKPVMPTTPMADRVRTFTPDIRAVTDFLVWLRQQPDAIDLLTACLFGQLQKDGAVPIDVERAVARWLDIDLGQLQVENQARGDYMRAAIAWSLEQGDTKKDDERAKRT